MAKTMEEISAEWKELRPLIGNFVGYLTSKEAQLVSMSEAYERGRTDGWAERDSLKSAEISDAYDKGYNDGFECGQHEATTLEYQRGLNDAWETARRIAMMNVHERATIFFPQAEAVTHEEPFKTYGVEEAIEKLKAYEEQKKAEEEAEIKVGDVLQYKDDHSTKIVVTGIHDSGMISGICVGNSCANVLGASYANRDPANWVKTGRHFPQVAEILKALEESDGS